MRRSRSRSRNGRISPLVTRSSAESGSSIRRSFGCGQERAADRHPLALAAGEIARRPVEQRRHAEQVGDLVEGDLSLSGDGFATRRAEQQVLAHREVRKQARFLEDVAERPLVGRQERSVAVLPDVAVDVADAVGEPVQARDAAQHRGLAAARRTEQRGHALRRRGEAGVERRTCRACRGTRRGSVCSAVIRASARSAFRSGSSTGSRRRRTPPCRRREYWPRATASSRQSRRWRST